ncbi:MAG: [LysW]-lysine hydrolase [Chloroflexi bacterium]|nr:[LysW]-lysine hydrolase [Chloroflexota bacterium]
MDHEGELDLLEGLLRCYSPTGQEREAVEYLVEQMRMLGYTATVDGAGNAVGWIGEGPREILCLGHIDTVPGNIDVRRDGEMLWGRGAVDAKGPLAAFVCAGARVEVKEGWRITVIGAVGEEGDSRGAKALLSRNPPDAAIIGEPSGWDRLTLGYKGSASFRYKVSRSQAHAASGNETACEVALRFWGDLQNEVAVCNSGKIKVFDQLTLSLRGMSSDQDGFKDTAWLEIGVRLPLGLDVRDLEKRFSKLAGEGEVIFGETIPAFRVDKNGSLVRGFLSAIRKQDGKPSFTLKSGTSDMNLVGPKWKCPMIAYGPGDSNLDHTPEERINLWEYSYGIKVLANAIQQVMNDPISEMKRLSRQ